MSELTDRQLRLLKDQTPEGRAFREGAQCEAEVRNAITLPHRELIEYCRAVAEAHPEWPSSEVAASIARVFVPARPVGPEETP